MNVELASFEPLLTATEAGRLLDLHPVTLLRWAREGRMSILFQHATRYGWATANPIRLVRQSALPLQEQIVLEPVEIAALLSELRDPFYTLILLATPWDESHTGPMPCSNGM